MKPRLKILMEKKKRKITTMSQTSISKSEKKLPTKKTRKTTKKTRKTTKKISAKKTRKLDNS